MYYLALLPPSCLPSAPKTASREKFPKRNNCVTEKPPLSPERAQACDNLEEKNRVRFHTPSEGWTGKEFDADIELTYFGARFYEPELGIWIGPDPHQQYLNPFLYANGDPINRIDPLGLTDHVLSPVKIIGCCSVYPMSVPGSSSGNPVNTYRTAQMTFSTENSSRNNGGENPTDFSDAEAKVMVEAVVKSMPAAKAAGVGVVVFRKAVIGRAIGAGKNVKGLFSKVQAFVRTLKARVSGQSKAASGLDDVAAKEAPLLPAPLQVPNASGVIRSFVQNQPLIYYRVYSGSGTGSCLTAVRPVFKNEPERRHFGEYLTGLMIAQRKTVRGMTAEFAEAADQSCLNCWLTEAN